MRNARDLDEVSSGLARMRFGPVPLPSCGTSAVSFTVLSRTPVGAQWLSGRVLDSRPRGPGFELHWRHCIVSLSNTDRAAPKMIV